MSANAGTDCAIAPRQVHPDLEEFHWVRPVGLEQREHLGVVDALAWPGGGGGGRSVGLLKHTLDGHGLTTKTGCSRLYGSASGHVLTRRHPLHVAVPEPARATERVGVVAVALHSQVGEWLGKCWCACVCVGAWCSVRGVCVRVCVWCHVLVWCCGRSGPQNSKPHHQNRACVWGFTGLSTFRQIVTVSNPRCGCFGNPGTVSPWSVWGRGWAVRDGASERESEIHRETKRRGSKRSGLHLASSSSSSSSSSEQAEQTHTSPNRIVPGRTRSRSQCSYHLS